ncbi:hypothetical protein [Desulfolithobacter sp.]
MVATILSMSEGGLQLNLPRFTAPELKVDNLTTLRCIQGSERLNLLLNIALRMVWIRDIKYLDHISIGMEFQQLSAAHRLPNPKKPLRSPATSEWLFLIESDPLQRSRTTRNPGWSALNCLYRQNRG